MLARMNNILKGHREGITPTHLSLCECQLSMPLEYIIINEVIVSKPDLYYTLNYTQHLIFCHPALDAGSRPLKYSL